VPNEFKQRVTAELTSPVMLKIFLEELCSEPREKIVHLLVITEIKETTLEDVRGCIQIFPDWPPGARTANGTALCH